MSRLWYGNQGGYELRLRVSGSTDILSILFYVHLPSVMTVYMLLCMPYPGVCEQVLKYVLSKYHLQKTC